MPVKVYIPTPFRRLVGQASHVEVEGANVAELLDNLEASFPGLRGMVVGPNGRIPDYMNLYVNNREITSLQGPDTSLQDGDEVAIIPAMAGGVLPGMLSEKELTKYDRQMRIEGFGREGQEKLKKSRVLVAGIGGLGCPVSLYLAVAGVGHLRLVDRDVAELSNLNRQVLHWDKDVGEKKAVSAWEKLSQVNSDIEIEAIATTITQDNILALADGCDLIIDAMDNYPTRYILNKAALEKEIPLIHGSIWGLEGMATTIIPGQTACLRCLFAEGPPPGIFPVIGITPGVIAMIQATEAIKYLTGIGDLLAGRLLLFDAFSMEFRTVQTCRHPECPACGDNSTISEPTD